MTETGAVGNAKRYLAGGSANVDDVLAWRLELRAGAPALARALSRKLAEDFISGEERTADQVDAIWRSCKKDEAFSHARRLLRRRTDPKTRTISRPPANHETAPSPQELIEQFALMTSKDPDLAASIRHDWALRILRPNLQTSSAETLGIARRDLQAPMGLGRSQRQPGAIAGALSRAGQPRVARGHPVGRPRSQRARGHRRGW